jgi:predicted HTH domain antitoxin
MSSIVFGAKARGNQRILAFKSVRGPRDRRSSSPLLRISLGCGRVEVLEEPVFSFGSFRQSHQELIIMSKTVRVKLEVPTGISDEVRTAAEQQAHETAVLILWQRQALTLREAAEELGLTYRAFLDLLAERGLPVEQGAPDLAALEEARQKVAGRHP